MTTVDKETKQELLYYSAMIIKVKAIEKSSPPQDFSLSFDKWRDIPIHYQDADTFHVSSAPETGTLADTRVPWPGRDTISRLPFKASMRSLIPLKPNR